MFFFFNYFDNKLKGNGYWIDNNGNEIRTRSDGCDTNIADIFSKKYLTDKCFEVISSNMPNSEMTKNMEQTTEELNFDLLETNQLSDYVKTFEFEETTEYFEYNDKINDFKFEFEPIDNDLD